MFEGFWVFPLLGIVAGILAGLLGVGGGLVLVGALAWLLPLYGVPQEAQGRNRRDWSDALHGEVDRLRQVQVQR